MVCEMNEITEYFLYIHDLLPYSTAVRRSWPNSKPSSHENALFYCICLSILLGKNKPSARVWPTWGIMIFVQVSKQIVLGMCVKISSISNLLLQMWRVITSTRLLWTSKWRRLQRQNLCRVSCLGTNRSYRCSGPLRLGKCLAFGGQVRKYSWMSIQEANVMPACV